MPFPRDELYTERLWLRRPRVTDAKAVFRVYSSDPEVARFVPWSPHESLRDAREYVEAALDAWDLRHGYRAWMVETRDDGELIGSIGVTRDAHRAECGYVYGRRAWGKGYATEALRAVIAHCFEERAIERVFALADCDNVASMRVMEKVGMKLEGTLRRFGMHPNASSEPRDCRMYAIVRADLAR